MDLWIRSQDREVLMNVNHLYLSSNSIIGYCQSTFTSPILGQYKTKERALEVLDEIDKLMSDAVNNGLKVARYKMPKE